MNLLCFTLDGSTESIYEPPCNQKLKEAIPTYQCSPIPLRRRLEWRGSDPSINDVGLQSTIKTKRTNRRSCLTTTPLNNETSDSDVSHVCWMSSFDKKHLSQQSQEKHQSSSSKRDESVKEQHCDRTQTLDQDQSANTPECINYTGRLKKLQAMMQTKKTHQTEAQKEKRTSNNNGHLANTLNNNSSVLTCIRMRTEKKPLKTDPSPHQQHQAEGEDPEDIWNTGLGLFECPQPWTAFYHTCQQPQPEPWVCSGNMLLPQATEWEVFNCLIQELDSKQSHLPPPPTTISDLKPKLNTVQNSELQRVEMKTPPHRKHVTAPPEKKSINIINGKMWRDEAAEGEFGGEGAFAKGQRRSSNSLESFYSNSGQSSSSGVTTGSDCSSNRDSLRLEGDLMCTRQFCGRARVHTEFVPSPYDTESLKLKVGDVIDIIARPPMGIWTGLLYGRVGNFKFIYVDVIREEYTQDDKRGDRERQKSTVQEVLKHLSLEEYSSSLQLNGYQTVDDLMKLREHHLTKLNVTDPEHRHRLLTAVSSLQQLWSDNQLEKETIQEADGPNKNTKTDVNSSSRDSGCHMPSDNPDNHPEDTDLHLISEYPAEMAS